MFPLRVTGVVGCKELPIVSCIHISCCSRFCSRPVACSQLSLENFDKLSKEFLKIEAQTKAEFETMIDYIFNKAVMQHAFSSMFVIPLLIQSAFVVFAVSIKRP